MTGEFTTTREAPIGYLNQVVTRHRQVGALSLSGQTVFNEVQVAEFSPLIELDSSNGLSPVRRDTLSEPNSATVTNANGEHKLSTGTTTETVAGLRTKERGRYQPGIEGLPGIAVRRPTAPTGDQELRWGYFDAMDGMWVGEDATGIFVRYRHNGTTEAKVYQADWNGDDKLDGSGSSGVTLDLTRFTIFRFPFVWYGGGPISVFILTTDPDGAPVYAKVHTFPAPTGEPILGNPKLPINAEADNGTTTSNIDLYVGGRQFAVLGRYTPNRRAVPEIREGVSVASGTTEPLISFRKKTDRQSQSKSVKVFSAGALSGAAGFLKIYIAPTLTGASFGAPSEVNANETACEVDISATAISGGTLIKTLPVPGSGRGNSQTFAGLQELGQDLPDNTIVTLAFTAGSSSATVDAAFEVEEEW